MELAAAIAELRPDLLQNEHRMAELTDAYGADRTWFRAIPRDLMAAYIVPMTRVPVRALSPWPEDMHARGRASYARFLSSILGPPYDLASWVAFRAKNPELRGLVYIRAADDDYAYRLSEGTDDDCVYPHNVSDVFPYIDKVFGNIGVYSSWLFALLPCGLVLCGVDIDGYPSRTFHLVLVNLETHQHRICNNDCPVGSGSVVDDFGNIILHPGDYPAGFNEYSATYVSFMA